MFFFDMCTTPNTGFRFNCENQIDNLHQSRDSSVVKKTYTSVDTHRLLSRDLMALIDVVKENHIIDCEAVRDGMQGRTIELVLSAPVFLLHTRNQRPTHGDCVTVQRALQVMIYLFMRTESICSHFVTGQGTSATRRHRPVLCVRVVGTLC